jgi:hypothetical protein
MSNISEKQQNIIDTVLKLNPNLQVTSITRENAKPSSGHSTNKQLAVDFNSKTKLSEMYDTFQVMQTLFPTWTLGLGILNAKKHLHVSNDDRGLRFLEIERPDKNNFVKVVTMGDKNYLRYLEIAKKEYEVNLNQDEKKKSDKKFVPSVRNACIRWFFLLFSFAKKIKL